MLDGTGVGLDGGTQGLHRSMEPGTDRSDRDTEHLCDAFMGQVGVVMQDHDGPLIGFNDLWQGTPGGGSEQIGRRGPLP